MTVRGQAGAVLGLNAFHGDASAVLCGESGLLCAVEEERFTRRKHEAGFPARSVAACLAHAALDPGDIGVVAVPRRPTAHGWSRLRFALSAPWRLALLGDRLRHEAGFGGIDRLVAEAAGARTLRARVHRVEHHRAHLASAFFASPFETAALFSCDGFGDFVSAMWGRGEGTRMRVAGHVEFPHSLGLAYTALTQYLGFPHYGDEYKVMGLASYGQPSYLDRLRRVVVGDGRGGYRLDLRYFTHHRGGASMTWASGSPVLGEVFSPALERLLGPRRRPEAGIEPRHQDIAASLQALLESIVLARLGRLADETRERRLCLAGGVALNCTLNGRILRESAFEEIYVQPAAHDGGLALGAALYVRHHVQGRPRDAAMRHAYWGLEYGPERCRRAIESQGLEVRELPMPALAEAAADLVAGGAVLGWFQGRFEWGPRALGNRSIVCDPRIPAMRDVLNRRIKRREAFRPFAPSVVAEAAERFFELPAPAPFMTAAYRVRPEARALIPAVTHVDGTARVQTVERDVNPKYWALLEAFGRRTGIPVLLNTSFNENEPIVNSPEEAVACFLRNDMDALVLGPLLVTRRDVAP
jgi:carbamoyltransferase